MGFKRVVREVWRSLLEAGSLRLLWLSEKDLARKTAFRSESAVSGKRRPNVRPRPLPMKAWSSRQFAACRGGTSKASGAGE